MYTSFATPVQNLFQDITIPSNLNSLPEEAEQETYAKQEKLLRVWNPDKKGSFDFH